MDVMSKLVNLTNNSKIMNWCMGGIGCILLFCSVMINIGKLGVLTVAPDEFGYWSAGAYFLGYDWHSVAAFSSYYQFGYGLILAVIMLFFDGIYLYKTAVIVNAIFLCIIFLVLREIGSIIYARGRFLNTIIAFSVCFYAANIAYAQTSLCEIFLQLMYIILIFFVAKAVDNNFDIMHMAICFMPLLVLYTVHLRSLGVIIISGIILLGLLLLKNGRKTVWIGLMLVAGFLAVGILKEIITNETYTLSELVSVNDYSGQISKLKSLLSISGIRTLFVEMIGQLWYLGTSSFLLIYVALWQGIKNIREIVYGNRNKCVLYESFILINFLAAYMISAIFCKDGKRIDSLIYGRYVEYTILPLLVSAIYALVMKKIKFKEISVLFLLHFVCGLCIDNVYQTNEYNSIVYTTITGIFKLVYKNENNFVFLACMWSVVIGCIGIIFFFCRHNWVMLLTLFLFASVWWSNGNAFIRDIGIKGWTDKVDVIKIYDVIETAEELPIYYVYSSEDTLYVQNRIFLLQVLLEDISVKCVEYNNFIPNENCYVVVNIDSKISSLIDKDYVKVIDGYPLTLYKILLPK